MPARVPGPRGSALNLFTGILLVLGVSYVPNAIVTWHTEDLQRFLVYVTTAVAAAVVMAKRARGQTTFSINLLLVPLGIVELTFPETLTLAWVGVIVPSFFSKPRSRPIQVITKLAIESTAVAAADFAYHSLIPGALKSVAIRLFLAGGAFFVARTVPSAIIAALTDGKRIGQTWKQDHFWSSPHYFVGASTAGFLSTRNAFLHWEACVLLAPVLYVLYRAHRMQEASTERQRGLFDEIRALHLSTIEALTAAMEAKDGNTGSHLNRVQIYAVELAKDLGLSEQETEALRAAALLHDIGKLAIPEQILSKPDKLTREEFARIKIHPIIGAEILDRARFPGPVASIVRTHHEKWDGSGYPEGLKGTEIPLGARILAAVDCLDALASDREYRRALPLDEAMEKVRAESGRSYDPRVVEALERRYRELEQVVKARSKVFPKLSKDVVVERGAAPGAGFLDDGESAQDELMRLAENVGLSSTDKVPSVASSS